MRNHADDILILSGLLLLGTAVYLAMGTTAVLAYAGTVLLVFGVVLGMRQPRGGKP